MDNGKWYIKYTFILAGVILTVYAMIVAKAVLLPLLFSLFLSILLSPLCGWLENYKIPRVISALIAIFCGLLVFVALGFFVYSQISAFVEDMEMVQRRIEEIVVSLDLFLATWFEFDLFFELETIEETVLTFINENMDALRRGLIGAAAMLTATFLVPIYMFLILILRDFLKEFLLQVFGRYSDESLQRIKNIIEKVKLVVQHYIRGMIMVIMILAILNSTLLLIVGVDHAIFFGVFAAMLNVIPFLGPIFGSFLPILYAILTMDSLIYPLIILLGFYVIQLFESNLFTPVIVGSKVSMNALVTLVLLFTGAQIWGLAGMILFIPLGAILKVIFDEVPTLQPYGFLMGRVPSEMTRKKGPLATKISNLSAKSLKKKKRQREKSKV